MDPVALATAFAAGSRAQVQLAAAARIAKMNAASGQSMAALIEAAGDNLEQLAKAALPPGLGANLDISA